MKHRLCKHTFPSGLPTTNHWATPLAHLTTTSCFPLTTPCNFSSFPLPLSLLFSSILHCSLFTSKLSITLAIDILYWFCLGSCLLVHFLRMYAASISEICAL